jgi:hypothetical protein
VQRETDGAQLTPELLLSLGALIAVSVVLVALLLLALLLFLTVKAWLYRQRKIFVERDDDGEVRFGGELRALPEEKHDVATFIQQ